MGRRAVDVLFNQLTKALVPLHGMVGTGMRMRQCFREEVPGISQTPSAGNCRNLGSQDTDEFSLIDELASILFFF